MPQKILEIYEIFILVIPTIAPTKTCIPSRIIGGTLIGLFAIVSISSINDITDKKAPIIKIIKSLFSRSGEKSQKIKMIGERMRIMRKITIPIQYGAGSRHCSLL